MTCAYSEFLSLRIPQHNNATRAKDAAIPTIDFMKILLRFGEIVTTAADCDLVHHAIDDRSIAGPLAAKMFQGFFDVL